MGSNKRYSKKKIEIKEKTPFIKFIDSCREEKRKVYNNTQDGQRFYFKSNAVEFTGRGDEFEYLNSFRAAADSILWTAITGSSGSGKSRLIYEYILKHGGENEWKMIFLNPEDPPVFVFWQ